MKIKFKIYNPAGNITALVIGDKYSLEERKIINNKIMSEDSRIEQVGFVSETEKRLTMAGGEFCGNATRSAILYYKRRFFIFQNTGTIDKKSRPGTGCKNYV